MMNIRRETACLAALVTGLVLGGAPGTSMGDPGPGEPVVFTGVLPADITDLEVQVRPAGDRLATLEVGDTFESHVVPDEGVTVTDRRYRVSLDPDALPPTFIDAAGVATFHVSALDETGTVWAGNLPARAVEERDADQPVWVDAADSAWWASRQLAGAGRRARGPVAGDSLPEHLVERAPEAPALARLGRGGQRVSAQRASARSTDCPYHVVLDRKKVWATLGTTYPVGASKATMRIDSSQGAKYGTAGSVGEYHPKRTGMAHADGAWAFTWSRSKASRSYRAQVKYLLHRWGRRNTQGECILEYEWLPALETGGVTSNTGLSRPGWRDHCAPVATGRWQRIRTDGKPYAYDYAVSIGSVIGFNLGISRQYSKPQRIQYFIRGSRPKRMCGNNADPSVSGKQIERFRG